MYAHHDRDKLSDFKMIHTLNRNSCILPYLCSDSKVALITVSESTKDKMLIYDCMITNRQILVGLDLSIDNSESKQRKPRPIRFSF